MFAAVPGLRHGHLVAVVPVCCSRAGLFAGTRAEKVYQIRMRWCTVGAAYECRRNSPTPLWRGFRSRCEGLDSAALPRPRPTLELLERQPLAIALELDAGAAILRAVVVERLVSAIVTENVS